MMSHLHALQKSSRGQVSDLIRGIPCVKNISDDVYVGGIDSDTHDQHLRQVFRQLQENGLTINLPCYHALLWPCIL